MQGNSALVLGGFLALIKLQGLLLTDFVGHVDFLRRVPPTIQVLNVVAHVLNLNFILVNSLRIFARLALFTQVQRSLQMFCRDVQKPISGLQ